MRSHSVLSSRSLPTPACLLAPALAAILACCGAAEAQGTKDCSKSSTGLVPLTELTGLYRGYAGGLYPGGGNDPPAELLDEALSRAASIEPVGPDGQPSPTGSIVILSIGMSNTKIETDAFRGSMLAFRNTSDRVVVVNGAESGADAQTIADPLAPYWTIVGTRLAQQRLTPEQVQVVWLKEALAFAPNTFPGSAITLRDDLAAIARIIHDRFPNAKLCFLSSRIYGGYQTGGKSPEPQAYEGGFSVRWLIEQQLGGDPSLNADPSVGPVEAPLLLWGPYLWADGRRARADGLRWVCTDFTTDGVHPSGRGAAKVAGELIEFMSTSPSARRWFVSNMADMDNDGRATATDSLLFQQLFASGDSTACDIDVSTGAGVCDALDIIRFQELCGCQ